MRKHRWVHFYKHPDSHARSPALCGKAYIGASRMAATQHKDETTCPRCLALLAEHTKEK